MPTYQSIVREHATRMHAIYLFRAKQAEALGNIDEANRLYHCAAIQRDIANGL